jgi:hypothetical protein
MLFEGANAPSNFPLQVCISGKLEVKVVLRRLRASKDITCITIPSLLACSFTFLIIGSAITRLPLGKPEGLKTNLPLSFEGEGDKGGEVDNSLIVIILPLC